MAFPQQSGHFLMHAKRERSGGSDGFTLIELVLVIVILGILAAFALPRFAALSSDARIATLDSVAGTMKSTIGIVRSRRTTEADHSCESARY